MQPTPMLVHIIQIQNLICLTAACSLNPTPYWTTPTFMGPLTHQTKLMWWTLNPHFMACFNVPGSKRKPLWPSPNLTQIPLFLTPLVYSLTISARPKRPRTFKILKDNSSFGSLSPSDLRISNSSNPHFFNPSYLMICNSNRRLLLVGFSMSPPPNHTSNLPSHSPKFVSQDPPQAFDPITMEARRT